MNGNTVPEPGMTATTKRHFVSLDGLRGVAALCVMLFHRRWWVAGGHLMDHGYLAVDFFFMLSGFVIAYAYENKLRSGMTFGRFALIRAIRLYPLIVVGAALGSAYFLLHAAIPAHRSELGGVLVSIPFAMLALPTLPQAMAEPFAINRPTWSLFVEILLNLAYALVIVRLSRSLLAALTALGFAALAVLAFAYGDLGISGTFDRLGVLLVRGCFPFLAGVLICRMFARGALPRLPGGFAAGALLLVILFMLPRDFAGGLAWLLDLLAVGLLCPAVIISCCEHEPPRWSLGFVKPLGELSYPLYIIHYPAYYWFEIAAVRFHLPPALWLPIAVPLIVALAFAISRAIDIPVRRALNRRLAGRA
ncbi:acyltransferase family protein [Sphingomonas bacterium]|uniref:acyltransferase family protein n=1 Tax=Sphingomonas bacterium TaxID=1895847 RepID=UPI001576E972|nr:acyltransferase [Sphingomonas bacterium]